MTEKSEGLSQRLILILCVDRDADLGTKADIKTPLIGRAANLNAAVSLALKDPEEADGQTGNGRREVFRQGHVEKGEQQKNKITVGQHHPHGKDHNGNAETGRQNKTFPKFRFLPLGADCYVSLDVHVVTNVTDSGDDFH